MERNPVTAFLYALHSLDLHMNMTVLATAFRSNITLPEFEKLTQKFEKFDAYLSDAADYDKKINLQKLSSSGTDFLNELKCFRKLPQTKEDNIQKLIEIGITHTQKVLDIEKDYSEAKK